MTILVTGAAGFAGAALVEHLLQRGDAVLALDRKTHRRRRWRRPGARPEAG